uniref:Uncharacterized protein n=1 Tax=Astyanax mexicanus TaxID=7994 RepID=A0A3B1IEM3_ASTMX
MSFTSITFTFIFMDPDLDGFPPSTAYSMSWITGCFSLSKAVCKTNSAKTLCSPPLCTSREKCSLGFSL